jgi:hypothetical protein
MISHEGKGRIELNEFEATENLLNRLNINPYAHPLEQAKAERSKDTKV